MAHKLKNGNPTPEAIREAMALLDKLPAEFQIIMDEMNAHPCGTVGCVAGAYAIARGINGPVDFLRGADWLAQDLGFANLYNMRNWANEKPNLWGNEKGYNIFSDFDAYGAKKQPTLDHVKQHFLSVADRIEALAN